MDLCSSNIKWGEGACVCGHPPLIYFGLMMRIAIALILVLILPIPCPAAEERVSDRDYAMLQKAYDQLQNASFEACLHTLSPLLGKSLPVSYALSYAALASSGLNRPDQAAGF